MKIVDVKTYVIENPPPSRGGPRWIFLKLVTDEGIEGAGECTYHNRLTHVAVELIKDLGSASSSARTPFASRSSGGRSTRGRAPGTRAPSPRR